MFYQTKISIVAGLVIYISIMGGCETDRKFDSNNTSTAERKELSPPPRQPGPRKIQSKSPYPMSYTIGGLDSRFGLSRQKLLRLISEAANIWETPVHLKLFRYDSSAGLKINLRFDERQATILKAKRLKSHLVFHGKTFDELKLKYDSEVSLKEKFEEQYKEDESELNRRLNNYNSKVTMWNDAGGAPADEFAALEQERIHLDYMKRNLENQTASLNEVVAQINDLAESLNELAAKYNLAVKNYNDQFITAREFEKGVWNGWTINLFEFENDNDLRITLVHELGHVLGFGHVDDPNAIMYYKLERQDIKHIRLTDKDLELLFAKFPKRS